MFIFTINSLTGLLSGLQRRKKKFSHSYQLKYSYLDIANKLDGGIILSAAGCEGMSCFGFIQRDASLILQRVNLIVSATRREICLVFLIIRII